MKIFVNGCFDIIHAGHIKLLKFAKSFNGLVLVALDSDRRVAELKGPGRPINTLEDRMSVIESIRYVDHVVCFDTDFELDGLVEYYRPEIMVKGSDYINKPIIGRRWCGQVHFLDRTDDNSTSKKIQSIIGS